MDNPIAFMGSPDFAVPCLQALVESFNVVGVVTQPDKPAGRGRQLQSPPVKTFALEHHLPVIQPSRLSSDEQALAQLRAWHPDVIVVVAFGQILRSEVLNLPKFGCLNVHASLLPRWRGAAPINAAILHGDKQTGVTIMKLDQGVDTGPTLSQRSTQITPQDNAETVFQRLAEMGAELLVETLPSYLAGELTPQPQEDSLATVAPMLQKEDGVLDFNLTAEELARKVRAYTPWPGTFTTWKGQRLKVHRAHAAAGRGEPGQHTQHEGLPAIYTADGLLVLDELQPAGKKAQAGDVFLLGARDWE